MLPSLVTSEPGITANQQFLREATDRVALIEQLLEIGTALSSTQNLDELLTLILTKSREITWSDAGSVYLVDRSGEVPVLWFKVAQNFSQPQASFQEFAMPLTPQSLAGYVALTGEPLNIADAYHLPSEVRYQLDRRFDQNFLYRTRSVLVLPMQNRDGETIGVLQLINRKLQPDSKITPENALNVTQPFSDWEMRLLRSLASQAAISIERNQLQESIEQLFEGFVRASVQIIETRDPCTSGHSERVAALTVALAKAANQVTRGALRSLHLSDRQIQELRYAALLHDFGKVGVPEALLGKQKKLFPLQLEVVKSRFAFAQRTLELACVEAKYQYLREQSWQRRHSTPEPDCLHCQYFRQLDVELTAAIAQLEQDWAMLLQANEPCILSEPSLTELNALLQRTYRDLAGQEQPLITAEELTQLLVQRGNLTLAERAVIQAHVSHTYEFLSRIPWTKPLQAVPTIAAAHHETLDGSGYPKGLQGAEIPIQAQMLTIADIYDALTAGDRPYKQGLPPQIALSILQQEAAHNKLNHDLVDLFEQHQIFSVLGHSSPREQP